jgi:hypothetical protein
VVPEAKDNYQSISKARTFTPASTDEPFVFAQLSKNLENACIKARRYRLAATRLVVFLRKQDFTSRGVEIKLHKPSSYPLELIELLRTGFARVFEPGGLYRQTGVVLAGLVPEDRTQYSLFDDTAGRAKISKIYESLDRVSQKYGKHTIQHGASLPANLQAQHEGERGDVPVRKGSLFNGESRRQRLGMPVLHIKI